ncbi:Cellulose synthase-like protein D2 [Castilleja foliolosa]|uniref:Cellulose synthase-like protein D2 n=1 Tax=Castilleja foliolosa TaxID=1961234 RepID=A0ABD3CLP1_9LAMI
MKATWMADGTHWPGTWLSPSAEHSKGDHAGIIQVMLKPPSDVPLCGTSDDSGVMGLTDVDIRLPMLVCVSREKCPGYDHNKKAGAMNSAIISNGAFILNLDCDHYIYNSEAMCEVLTRMIAAVTSSPRSDSKASTPPIRYGSRNTVFFDDNMRALNGLQGPVYVGTGCLFRQVARPAPGGGTQRGLLQLLFRP